MRTTNGVSCNRKWISARNCTQHKSCSECLASWPTHLEEGQVSVHFCVHMLSFCKVIFTISVIYCFPLQTCKWCKSSGSGFCIDIHSDECGKNEPRTTSDVTECPERQCPASDCDQCRAQDNCVWTRQVLRTSEMRLTLTSDPSFDWSCAEKNVKDRTSLQLSTPPVCPKRCAEHRHCDTCLRSHGAEGGWHECRWSTQLHEVNSTYSLLLVHLFFISMFLYF